MLTFKETGLRPELLRAIEEMGYENPTEIQAAAIPALLESKTDLIALAQTGTGKTAAFGLPLLNQLDLSNNDSQALILCPTRELAIQIMNDLGKYTKYLPQVRVTAVYGGAAMGPQIRAIQKGTHVIVGTPGRVLDLVSRGVMQLDTIQTLVLDEADEMLNMGFQKDLDAILSETPKEKQTLFFSATMPREFKQLTKNYMTSPREISVGQRNSGASQVEHDYFVVHAKDRYEALKRLIDSTPNIYGIVFCRTRIDTTDVARKLIQDGYLADAINGDLSQAQRDEVMDRFRTHTVQLMVATDVAARGIDVHDLTHVINFDLPDDPEVYVHRSGRTGRAGKSGVALSIVHMREMGKIRTLERMVNKKFTRKQVPNGEQVCEKQLFYLMDKIEQTVVDEEQITPYLPMMYEKLESMDREELLKRVVSVEFNRFLEFYKNAPDLNVEVRDSRDRDRDGGRERDRGPRDDGGSFTKFRINLGTRDQVHPARLMALINDVMPSRVRIGKIDIRTHETFFEIATGQEDALLQAFKKEDLDGVKVELLKGDAGFGGGGNGGGGNFKPKFSGKPKGPRKRVVKA